MEKPSLKIKTVKPLKISKLKPILATNQPSLRPLAEAVGDFIRYWGFRKIHGEIWLEIFLSNKSLSGADLVKKLAVSKALISPALKELEHHTLIYQIKSSDCREKRYAAEPDFTSVIKKILKQRELQMLNKVQAEYKKIDTTGLSKNAHIDLERLNVLGSMVGQAQLGLNFLLEMNV